MKNSVKFNHHIIIILLLIVNCQLSIVNCFAQSQNKSAYIVQGDSTIFSAEVSEIDSIIFTPAYEIRADINPMFGSLHKHYTQPNPMTVAILNIGTRTVTLNALPAVDGYTLTPLSQTTLDAGELATFTIRPNAGLGVGTYNRTFTITGSNGTKATITTEFAVIIAQGAPFFTKHPENLSGKVGSYESTNKVTTTVEVMGDPVPELHWQVRVPGVGKAWVDLYGPGSQDPTFYVASSFIFGWHNYQFRCYADNIHGSDTSNIATITAISAPPVIWNHPNNYTIWVGGSHTFSAYAVGFPEVTKYYWQISTNGGTTWTNLSNGGNYKGADTWMLTVIDIPLSFRGNVYRCIASNGISPDAVTNPALLSMYSNEVLPYFWFHPANATVYKGYNTTFKAYADGYPEPTLQWQVSANGTSGWTNLNNGNTGECVVSGAKTEKLELSAVASSMNGKWFRCAATNSEGSAYSNAAKLTVNPGIFPTFTKQPQSVINVFEGNTVYDLEVGVSGTPGASLQWQVSYDGGNNWSNCTNGSTYSGFDCLRLTIHNVLSTMYGEKYRCKATNGAGTAYSNVAFLNVIMPAPVIHSHPYSVADDEGKSAIFSVHCNIGSSLKFQWQEASFDGTSYEYRNITGNSTATTATLVLNGITSNMDQNYYRCKVFNPAGEVYSNPAKLSVYYKPIITKHPYNIFDKVWCKGSQYSLSVTAKGNPEPTYQWQSGIPTKNFWYDKEDTNDNLEIIWGTKTPTFYHKRMWNGCHSENHYYRCKVKNSKGTTISNVSKVVLVESW